MRTECFVGEVDKVIHVYHSTYVQLLYCRERVEEFEQRDY